MRLYVICRNVRRFEENGKEKPACSGINHLMNVNIQPAFALGSASRNIIAVSDVMYAGLY